MKLENQIVEAAGPPAQPWARVGARQVAGKMLTRRALHRVEAAGLDLWADLYQGGAVLRGQVLNVSAGGCLLRVSLPLTLVLDPRVEVSLALPLGCERRPCAAALVGLEMEKDAVRLRLRFGDVDPATRLEMLSWMSELLTRGFARGAAGEQRLWGAATARAEE